MTQVQTNSWTNPRAAGRATVRVGRHSLDNGTSAAVRRGGVVAFATLLACSTNPVNAATFHEITGTRPAAIAADQRRAHKQSIPQALAEIRRKSSLTWEQLAAIFSVTRRTVHSWYSGSEARPKHQEKIFGLLSRIRAMNESRTFVVRRAVLVEAGLTDQPSRIAVPASASGPLPIADTRPLEAKLVTNKVATKTKIVRAKA